MFFNFEIIILLQDTKNIKYLFNLLKHLISYEYFQHKYFIKLHFLFSATVPAKPGEEEGNLDSLAVSVVEKSLEIFNLISNVFKTSTRAGGHVSLFTIKVNSWM